MSLLSIKDLTTQYRTSKGYLKALADITLTIEEGESFGLVGESGCGKSTLIKSILRLLPKNGKIERGEILYKGRDILKMTSRELQNIRWKEISLVSQAAMNALDPVYKVGYQIAEAIKTHEDINDSHLQIRLKELFDIVGLDYKRKDNYPHEFSGGMKQRVVIAMALALNPSLVIADEPTSALDVLVQDKILKKINELQSKLKISLLLVTHDISVVVETCQRMAIIYAGKIMEYGPTLHIIESAFHPYTLGLLKAFPSIKEENKELISIPGFPPNLLYPLIGCVFEERCPFSDGLCKQEAPEIVEVEAGHFSACHMRDRIEDIRKLSGLEETWQ
jgi:peptide/nickel transport system ATP-binding protein